MTAATPAPRSRSLAPLWPLAACLVCVAWAFLSVLAELWATWGSNPQYSHGYLVPLFAAYLLYARRDLLDHDAIGPSVFGGVLLAFGIAMRLYATHFHYSWVDAVSIVPILAGAWWLVGGWTVLRWSYPALLFLVFMIPLPYSVANTLSGPLQRLATVSSAFFMQTLGMPALPEGNVILLNDHQIDIIDACNGLRMLVVFFALATALVMVVRRPLLDKLIIVASAVPIALVANIARITLTGFLFEVTTSEAAHAFSHDLAGWFMMPFALALLYVEMCLLGWIFVEDPHAAAAAKAKANAKRAAQTPRPRSQRRPAATPRRKATPAPQDAVQPAETEIRPTA